MHITKIKRIYSVLFLLLTFALAFLFTSTTNAQAPTTGINLTLSPVFVSLITDPGEATSTQLRIRNNSNVREELQIKLATFEANQQGDRPVLRPMGSQDEFASWIDFSEEKFTIDPNETKTIRATITPSEDAALGYYYAVVFQRVNEAEGNESAQAVISASPAIPVLLEVNSPNAKRELQLVDFKAQSGFFEYLPVDLTLQVRNTGNIHAVPVGDIFIDSQGKEDIAVLPVNKGRGNILPNGTRSFTVSWEDGFAVRGPDGTKYDFSKANKFRIGKYKANALLIYDNGERDIPMQASVSFWVFPWKIVGGALIISLFVFLGIKSQVSGFAKRFKKK